MSAELELRPLQASTLAKVSDTWKAGKKNVLVQAPCGFGKTEVATAMLQATYENGQRGAFICDRISLINQTGDRFDRYGLPHGVIQASHWRWRPYERIQLCSIQTLQRRTWPDVSLLVADEAHVLPRALKRKLAARESFAVGLTATPFAKGMGKYFDAVVNASTTNELIREGWLVPFRIFAPSEPDMDGVKVVKGEWEEAETERRVLPVVGDCVEEYMKRGDGRKFIAFAVSVAHAEELQRQFMAAGIVVNLYTYRQNDAERARSVAEFRKPDSFIRGLISIESLTRGFDVADIGVLILARPLRKSLTVHLQMIGRVLRTAEGKEDAIILDHAGNTVRFWARQNAYMEFGATELDDGQKPDRRAGEAQAKLPVTCPACAHVHEPEPHCPMCGHEYPKRRSQTQHLAGELRELVGQTAEPGDERQALYSQLLYIAHERGYKAGWAAHKFRERMGGRVWPDGLVPVAARPTVAVRNWVRSRDIAYAKGRKRRPAA